MFKSYKVFLIVKELRIIIVYIFDYTCIVFVYKVFISIFSSYTFRTMYILLIFDWVVIILTVKVIIDYLRFFVNKFKALVIIKQFKVSNKYQE